MHRFLPMTISLPIALITVILSGSCSRESEPFTDPAPVSRVETIVDTIHGTPVEDPYRWLEDTESDDVQTWTEAQNAYYHAYVRGYKDYGQVAGRMEELLNIGTIRPPQVRKGKFFYLRRDPGQDHAVLYMKKSEDAPEEVVIDPNGFSNDGTVAMDWYYVSSDGSLIAFGKSTSGSEMSTLFVIDTDTQELLPDTIPYTRAASLAWLPDNSGFYYTRFATPGDVPPGDENYYRRIYFHSIGTGWEQDSLILGERLDKADWPGVSLSPNGRWLVCTVYRGSTTNQVLIKYLMKDEGFVSVVTNGDALYYVTPLNDRFLILTNHGSPMFRVLYALYASPAIEDWKEIVPERQVRIAGLSAIGSHIVLETLENAASQIEIYRLSGDLVRTLTLPTMGTVSHVTGEYDDWDVYFHFYSFNTPSVIYRYNLMAEELAVYDKLEPPIDLSDVVVEQVWYNSPDGTPVSMFIAMKQGTPRDGSAPCYLYGYGGFNVSETPFYSSNVAFWLDFGGIYALPNLRGGGESGEEWHRAGMLERKQNTFDDFIAAAEYLIDSGYTTRDKLVISGGSNGGLLTGAVVTQRPDLCRAAIVSVPLLDMIRYHQFLIARLWIPEYGSSEDSAQFTYLLKYSPYHNVRPNTPYPAILLTTGESEGRVHPMHARKMAARLQAATSSSQPVFVFIEPKGGHGQGKPIRMIASELADTWSFVLRSLGLSYK